MIQSLATRVLAFAGAALLFTGCASGSSHPVGNPTGSSTSGRALWQQEISDAAASATNPEEKNALSDGVITDQEYAHFQELIASCFSALGLNTSFNDEGDLEYSNPDNLAPKVIDQCNTDNGIRVLILRDAMVRNPEHLDEDELMASCLRATGIVPKSYTAERLRRGQDVDSIETSEEFRTCSRRPLDVLENH